MTNINITTNPTGRSPENKYFFGEATSELCKERPKYCKIGNMVIIFCLQIKCFLE